LVRSSTVHVSSEDSVPVLAAIGVYMLLPSGLFACAALATSLLLANLSRRDSDTDELLCSERVTGFLWAAVCLFYATTASHLAALFGPHTWCRGGVLGKGLALGGFSVLLALGIVAGHFLLRDDVLHSSDHTLCEGSVFHWMLVADLACMYSFFLALFLTVLLSYLGACRSVPETHEDVADRAQAIRALRMQQDAGAEEERSAFFARPGAGIDKTQAYSRRGGARIAQATGPAGPALSLQSNQGWGRSSLDDPSQLASPVSASSRGGVGGGVGGGGGGGGFESVHLHVLATPSAANAGGGGGFERAFALASPDSTGPAQVSTPLPVPAAGGGGLSLEAESDALFASRAHAPRETREELRRLESSFIAGSGDTEPGVAGRDPNRLYSPVSRAPTAPADATAARHDRVFDDDEADARSLGERMPLTPKFH